MRFPNVLVVMLIALLALTGVAAAQCGGGSCNSQGTASSGSLFQAQLRQQNSQIAQLQQQNLQLQQQIQQVLAVTTQAQSDGVPVGDALAKARNAGQLRVLPAQQRTNITQIAPIRPIQQNTVVQNRAIRWQ